jgi:hypothetical protein
MRGKYLPSGDHHSPWAAARCARIEHTLTAAAVGWVTITLWGLPSLVSQWEQTPQAIPFFIFHLLSKVAMNGTGALSPGNRSRQS